VSRRLASAHGVQTDSNARGTWRPQSTPAPLVTVRSHRRAHSFVNRCHRSRPDADRPESTRFARRGPGRFYGAAGSCQIGARIPGRHARDIESASAGRRGYQIRSLGAAESRCGASATRVDSARTRDQGDQSPAGRRRAVCPLRRADLRTSARASERPPLTGLGGHRSGRRTDELPLLAQKVCEGAAIQSRCAPSEPGVVGQMWRPPSRSGSGVGGWLPNVELRVRGVLDDSAAAWPELQGSFRADTRKRGAGVRARSAVPRSA
jgi:hypothetical protein